MKLVLKVNEAVIPRLVKLHSSQHRTDDKWSNHLSLSIEEFILVYCGRDEKKVSNKNKNIMNTSGFITIVTIDSGKILESPYFGGASDPKKMQRDRAIPSRQSKSDLKMNIQVIRQKT